MDINHILHWPIDALVALVAGVLVLLVPRLLHQAIATYLLVVGVLGLLQGGFGHAVRLQAIAALVAGILILARPALLSYAVGIYLILIAVLGLGLVQL